MRVAANKILKRHGDAKFFAEKIHRVVEGTRSGNGAVEILRGIKERESRAVINQLAMVASRAQLGMEAIGTANPHVDVAACLDPFSGGELSILPDFGLYRKEFSVAEE